MLLLLLLPLPLPLLPLPLLTLSWSMGSVGLGAIIAQGRAAKGSKKGGGTGQYLTGHCGPEISLSLSFYEKCHPSSD